MLKVDFTQNYHKILVLLTKRNHVTINNLRKYIEKKNNTETDISLWVYTEENKALPVNMTMPVSQKKWLNTFLYILLQS